MICQEGPVMTVESSFKVFYYPYIWCILGSSRGRGGGSICNEITFTAPSTNVMKPRSQLHPQTRKGFYTVGSIRVNTDDIYTATFNKPLSLFGRSYTYRYRVLYLRNAIAVHVLWLNSCTENVSSDRWNFVIFSKNLDNAGVFPLMNEKSSLQRVIIKWHTGVEEPNGHDWKLK